MKKYFAAIGVLVLACLPVRAGACPRVDGLADLNCDGKVQILCFGDSITEGVADELGVGYPGRLYGMFPNAEIINLGDSGEMTFRGRTRSAQLFPFFQPDYVIILEGVNDYFAPGATPGGTRDNVLQIVQNARAVGAVTLLGNLTAIRRNEQRSWVLNVNQQLNPFKQIDFFALGEGIISGDLLHPNGAGYQVMADIAIAPALRAISMAVEPVDSDGDGVYDFKENQVGSNPLVADTDGDTLDDFAELFIYGTNPTLTDSDGDGLSDPQEVNEIGSNPTDPRPGPPIISNLQVLTP